MRFSLIGARAVLLIVLTTSGSTLGRSECLPRGIWDMSTHIGYLAQVDHSVVAIDLRNGKTVWTSSNASAPLALSEGGLLAASDDKLWRSGQFTVAILDAKTGQLRVRSTPITLGVSPAIPAEPMPPLTANFEKKGLVLCWETSSLYRGGAAPPIQRANIPPSKIAHSVVVDPITGELRETTLEPAHPDSNVIPPTSVSYRRHGEWAKGPWFFGNTMANIESREEGKGTKAELRVWDRISLSLRATIELTRGGSDIAPYVTADGKYVLLPSSSQSNHEWRVFSVANAREIGRAQLGSDPEDMCVVDSQLLYLSSVPTNPGSATIVVRSVDLDSGRQEWERTLGQRQVSNFPKLPQ